MASVRRLLPLFVLALILSAASYSAAAGSTSPVLDNAMVAVSASQASCLGEQGVSVTYNDTTAQPVSGEIIASIQNSAGNTVYISAQVADFAPKQERTFCFGPAGLPSGSYTARLFVADPSGVPVSVTSTVTVNL